MSTQARALAVWREVEIGSECDYVEVIRRKKLLVMKAAKAILPSVPLAKEKITVKLIKTNLAELGFPDWATEEDVLAAYHKDGLRHCPAEVALKLFCTYEDQPHGEYLYISIPPLTVNHPKPIGKGIRKGKWVHSSFRIISDRGQYLTCCFGKGGGVCFRSDDVILFSLDSGQTKI